MIDWHCHLLPGLDDGSDTMTEALAMARLLAGAGFVTVHCTPHCMPGRYDNTPSIVRRATERLQREVLQAGIRLAVKPGMEYYLDENFPAQLENLQLLGDTRLLLVEIPSRASVEQVRQNLRHILDKGLVPLLAHPERSILLNRSSYKGGFSGILVKGLRLLGARGSAQNESSEGSALLSEFKAMGCRFQGNLSSFAGWYGRGPQRQASNNLTSGLYSHLGSDGHSRRFLEQTLRTALSMLKDDHQSHQQTKILLTS